jgi:hypothetical protein
VWTELFFVVVQHAHHLIGFLFGRVRHGRNGLFLQAGRCSGEKDVVGVY